MTHQNLPDHLRGLLPRAAQHEVGHWITARQLGFPVGYLSLTIRDFNGSYEGGSEIILTASITTNEEIASYLEKRIAVLLAGVLAEWLKGDSIDMDAAAHSLTTTAANDSAKMVELANLLRNIRHPGISDAAEAQATLDVLLKPIHDQVAKLVIESKEVVHGLGARLASEVKAVGPEYRIERSEIEGLPAIRKFLRSRKIGEKETNPQQPDPPVL